MAVVITVIIAFASLGSLYASGVFSQHGCSLTTFGASEGLKPLMKGDYAEYTGKVYRPWFDYSPLTGTYLANDTGDETMFVKVVDTNSTSVQWTWNQTITSTFFNESGWVTYWTGSGGSPFPYPWVRPVQVSTDQPRLVCAKVLYTTVSTFRKPELSPEWHTYTYYYLAQSPIFPVEITEAEYSLMNPSPAGMFPANSTLFHDLYLTSTNFSGTVVVKPSA